MENVQKKLSESDVQVSLIGVGNPADSTGSPFSDKLMMYCTSILVNFGLGSNAMGTSFSLLNDIPIMMLETLKDVYSYGNEDGNLMAKHGWLEEPSQMEDRNMLI